MLQQTRVETVIPYYERFLAALPTTHALAEAPLDRVLELWSGLGYYRRARMLHRGAQEVVERHDGVVPREPKSLGAISGIGRYTAGAIASIAFGVEAPIVDGNVARVLSRVHALEDASALWALAGVLVRGEAPGDLNQALMELGAMVCTPKKPACASCPLARFCVAHERGEEEEFPRATPKRAPTNVSLRAYVIVDEKTNAMVWAKRRVDALYGGMWEPPMLAENDDASRTLGLGKRTLVPRGRLCHVLTHRRLTIDVLCTNVTRGLKLSPFGDYQRLELGPIAAPGRAMSRLARRVIELANRADPATDR